MMVVGDRTVPRTFDYSRSRYHIQGIQVTARMQGPFLAGHRTLSLRTFWVRRWGSPRLVVCCFFRGCGCFRFGGICASGTVIRMLLHYARTRHSSGRSSEKSASITDQLSVCRLLASRTFHVCDTLRVWGGVNKAFRSVSPEAIGIWIKTCLILHNPENMYDAWISNGDAGWEEWKRFSIRWSVGHALENNR